MAKYFIREESELGQDLLDIVGQTMLLIENDEMINKTYMIETLNEIIRTAKAIRTRLTYLDQYNLNNYRVI